MTENFKDHLEKLPFCLFHDGAVAQPKLVYGAQIIAADLADYVEIYVDRCSKYYAFNILQ